jgi:ribose transport system substrate-binding protein
MSGKGMFRKSFNFTVGIIVILSMILAGCVSPTQTPTQPQATDAQPQATTVPQSSGKLRFGLVLGDMSNPFFSTVADAAKAAAAAAGNIELVVLGSNNLEEQVKAVEDMISSKVDLIGVSPFDAQGITPTVEKANAAGIPVITVDENAAGGKVSAYIATDNVEGGRLAGEWIVKAMGGKGKMAILEGGAGSSTNNARLEGLHSVIDGTAIEVVASLPADWARDKGLQVMNDILTGNPDLSLVMAMNDEMALGALQAIKAAGKENQIKLVGYNGALEAIKSVHDNGLAADVVQYPEEMGKLYIVWGIRILNGENPPEVHIKPAVSVVDSQLLQKLRLAVTGK